MTLSEVLYAYDLTLAQLVFQRFGRTPNERFAWELVSHTADAIFWFLMVLPAVVVMWYVGLLDHTTPATWTVFIVFYACNIVDTIANTAMKAIVRRTRPPHHQIDSRFVGVNNLSFPSGHATRCWLFVAFICDLYNRYPVIVRDFFPLVPDVAGTLTVLWALVISFSRLALGRHYPSDILAGALIGSLVEYPITMFLVRHLTSLTNF